MKILVIGFLVFFAWSALSTYIYVCKIKGFCSERETIQTVPVSQLEVIGADTSAKTLVHEQAAVPENMLIYFAFDKSEFISDAKTVRYFDESNAYLIQNSKAVLNITGYTDAIGYDEYNQALGYRRAQTVKHFFESKGMPAAKILIESKGEKEPAEDNSTMAGRAKNRRTVITIKH